ncbi:hypothetical protein [Marinobacter sp. BGYM27]|uniref:hypothetical protein n=1 Tax=unclassified Marinobacter TaxID=83889 RepID=UPI0021A6CD36|nr:hypothetical protein [Marinobacter sp. BGYM27]MDG5499588.1 hypothetical protein [Marinobacter sp. BGYM27]
MKNKDGSANLFVRYALLCLALLVLTACGDNDDSVSGGDNPEEDEVEQTVYAFKILTNLNTKQPGLYNFGSDGSAELVREFDGGGAIQGELGGITYFTATTNLEGRELWRTDGTSDGTYIIKDLFSGGYAGFVGNKGIIYKNALYFQGQSNAYQATALWKFVDESTGPEFVVNTRNSNIDHASPGQFLEYNGQLIFYSNVDDHASGTGSKVFAGLGTADNDQLIDSNVTWVDGFSADFALAFKGSLYFRASAGDYIDGGKGYVLYKSDGTPAGTQVFADINETLYSDSNADIRNLVSVGDYFVFRADNAADDNSDTVYRNTEIWASDGTQAGTRMIKDLYPGSTSISSLVSVGNTAFFVARKEGAATVDIWRTQGTEATTKMIHSSEDSAFLYVYDDQIIAVTGNNTDGYVVSSLNSATDVFTPQHTFSSSVDKGFVLGNRYFVLTDSDNEGWNELWSYQEGDNAYTQVKIDGDYAVGVSKH